MNINEAAAQGIERLRRPIWSDPMDHIKIDIIDGRPGPWIKLYCPFNQECNGVDPVQCLTGDMDRVTDFDAYTGPLPDSDEYKAAQAKYAGTLGNEAGPSNG